MSFNSPLKSFLVAYQILMVLESYNKLFRLLTLKAWTWKLTYLVLVPSIQCLRLYSGGILLGRLGAITVLELLKPLVLFVYSKLGVPVKTTISANVLEEALNGTVTIRPLPIGTSVSGKVLTWFLS